MSVRDDWTSRPEHEWVRTGDPRHWRLIVQEHPVFGDNRLTLAARGVYARITAVPMGETFTAASLATSTDDDAATVQAGLNELEAHGYLAEVAR
ncbi:hypothetical protein [Streptomyces sp. NPDC018584]|uniref:hypothetical protein n=1 Tax=unclassified Streptomyces TaxID=2593676 RepID=UPI0037B08714